MKKIILSLSIITLLGVTSTNTVSAQMNMKANKTSVQKGKYTHAMFTVKGNCETCKTRIEKTAKSVKGVESAVWEQKTGMLHLNYDPKQTSPGAISKAIALVGHDTQYDKAPNKAYNALPGCCKYKR
ncbi:MAG: copper chaperone [Dysgonamonadaceae bacterium]